jgi:hypothetical protein
VETIGSCTEIRQHRDAQRMPTLTLYRQKMTKTNRHMRSNKPPASPPTTFEDAPLAGVGEGVADCTAVTEDPGVPAAIYCCSEITIGVFALVQATSVIWAASVSSVAPQVEPMHLATASSQETVTHRHESESGQPEAAKLLSWHCTLHCGKSDQNAASCCTVWARLTCSHELRTRDRRVKKVAAGFI